MSHHILLTQAGIAPGRGEAIRWTISRLVHLSVSDCPINRLRVGEMPLARSIAIVNQKGGVGKTTTAINLSSYAAAMGRCTLLVDIDAQGNATSGLGVSRSDLSRCIYDLLVAEPGTDSPSPAEFVLHTATEGFDLLPATINLAGAEIRLASAIAREMRLRRALSSLDERYDLIVIDTAPSLGLLTINSLAAADSVLIPIQCEYYALEGLTQLLDVIQLVRRDINQRLEIAGVVLTMFDGRTNLSREVADQVTSFFRGRVFNTKIPRNIRLAEAPSHGLPISAYEPTCKGARAYRRLTMEVLGIAKKSIGPRP